MRAGRPVLLPLSAVRPEDAPPLNWTRGALLSTHGDVEVEVLSKSTQVTADQFGGGGTRLQRRDTLRGFVEAHLDSGGAAEAADNPPYIFSQRALPALSAELEVGGLATLPAFLRPADHKRHTASDGSSGHPIRMRRCASIPREETERRCARARMC